MKFNNIILLATFIISNLSYSQEFKMPESAAYDTIKNRYFVSNFGDGSIIQINSTGKKTYFKKGLSKPLGILIYKNTLYVVDNPKTIRGFNLINGASKLTVEIKEALFLNDITADNAGFLYITDSQGGAIYKINIASQSYSLFVKTQEGPNGIAYDKLKNRLLVCYFKEKAPIDEINIEDLKISTLTSTKFTNLDGITLDNEGNCYVSAWGAGSFETEFKKKGTIYKFDNSFTKKPRIVSNGFHGPADIYFNIWRNELVIPCLLSNHVISIPLKRN